MQASLLTMTKGRDDIGCTSADQRNLGAVEATDWCDLMNSSLTSLSLRGGLISVEWDEDILQHYHIRPGTPCGALMGRILVLQRVRALCTNERAFITRVVM